MDEIEMLKEKCAALEKALAAAHVETAKVELRARDLKTRLHHLFGLFTALNGNAGNFADYNLAASTLAAAPDSDARLREVMLRVAEWVHEVVMSAPEPVIKSELPEIVDEVLRGGA